MEERSLLVIHGVIMGVGGALTYFGITLLEGNNCTPNGECGGAPYGEQGLVLLLLGIVLLLYGFGSLVGAPSRWQSRSDPRHAADYDPVHGERPELRGQNARAFVLALFAVALIIAEAFPLYSLYQETTNVPRPTFNGPLFAIDVLLFAAADLSVLVLAYVYLVNR